jgi:hypothetical protein
MVAAPMMAAAFVRAWRRTIPGLYPGFLLKAVLVGSLLAFPWWQRSWREALNYAQYSSQFARHSLGGFGFSLLMQWFHTFARSALDLALLLLIVAVLAHAIASRHACAAWSRTVRSSGFVWQRIPLTVQFWQNQTCDWFLHRSRSLGLTPPHRVDPAELLTAAATACRPASRHNRPALVRGPPGPRQIPGIRHPRCWPHASFGLGARQACQEASSDESQHTETAPSLCP